MEGQLTNLCRTLAVIAETNVPDCGAPPECITVSIAVGGLQVSVVRKYGEPEPAAMPAALRHGSIMEFMAHSGGRATYREIWAGTRSKRERFDAELASLLEGGSLVLKDDVYSVAEAAETPAVPAETPVVPAETPSAPAPPAGLTPINMCVGHIRLHILFRLHYFGGKVTEAQLLTGTSYQKQEVMIMLHKLRREKRISVTETEFGAEVALKWADHSISAQCADAHLVAKHVYVNTKLRAPGARFLTLADLATSEGFRLWKPTRLYLAASNAVRSVGTIQMGIREHAGYKMFVFYAH